MDIDAQLNDELRRLKDGPAPGETPGGAGTVRFLVRCPYGTSDVLTKAKILLYIMDEAILKGWPAHGSHPPCLPEWFTSACVAEMSTKQAARWLDWWKSLSLEERTRVEIEKDWSLDNWLYWMEPENRHWFWWDAKVLENYDHIALAIEVDEWPFPWGALSWLFRASGASSVEAEQ